MYWLLDRVRLRPNDSSFAASLNCPTKARVLRVLAECQMLKADRCWIVPRFRRPKMF